MLTPALFATLFLSAGSQSSDEQLRELRRQQLPLAELTTHAAVIAEGSSNPGFMNAVHEALRLQTELGDEIYLPNYLDKAFDDGATEFNKLSKAERAQVNALLGHTAYLSGKDDEAIELLSKVTNENPFQWARAQYTLGVIKTDRTRSETDLESGIKVFIDITASKISPPDIVALANIALGRIAYRKGAFGDAVRYYERVGVQSVHFVRARFELGFARFRNGDPNGALGALAVFQVPQLKDEYLPEIPILTATIYASLCRYDYAKKALDEFDKRYAPLIAELEKRTKGQGGKIDTLPDGFRQWLFTPRRLQGYVDLNARIDRELRAIRDPSRLAEPVAELKTLREAIARAQTTATNRRLEEALSSLRNYSLASEATRFDILRAAKENANVDIPIAMRATKRPAFSVKNIIWPLSDKRREYWADELAYLRVQVSPACAQKAQK